METHRVTRYVTALREGGSLPGLVEADDDGLYVLKLRGAGQGLRALVSEILIGELARALGLHVPRIDLLDLDPAIGRAEPDPEIQHLLKASAGLNVGLDFLPASLPYAPFAGHPLEASEAAAIVWLDLLSTNVDRTPRNTNLLWWHHHVWLIDHGAALYRQHAATLGPGEADRPFPQIVDHVLLPLLGSAAIERRDALREAHARLAPLVTDELLTGIAALLPEGWAGDHDYAGYLAERVRVVERQLAESEGFEVTGSASSGPGTGGLPRGPEAGRGLGPRVGAPKPKPEGTDG